jgi:hypothetical protein
MRNKEAELMTYDEQEEAELLLRAIAGTEAFQTYLEMSTRVHAPKR